MENSKLTLYDVQGRRKYLTEVEGLRVLETARTKPAELYALIALLTYTGCRISEALQLRGYHLDEASNQVQLRRLKRRGNDILWRSVPIPAEIMDLLYALSKNAGISDGRLFPFNRQTAWRYVKHLMQEAGISSGPHCCCKGFRHRFGVVAVTHQVSETLLQKWMGHSKRESTAVYLNVVGEEEIMIAQKMWPEVVLP